MKKLILIACLFIVGCTPPLFKKGDIVTIKGENQTNHFTVVWSEDGRTLIRIANDKGLVFDISQDALEPVNKELK